MAVHVVQQAERHNENVALGDSTNKVWLNPSRCLVDKALEMWSTTKMRADNTSVVTLMLDPPGPPRAQVLRSKRKNAYEDSGLEIMTRYEEENHTKNETPPTDIDKNFVPKPRESTSFHPNESETVQPPPVTEPENIQINEISSSSNSEETTKPPQEPEKPAKMNLRSTSEKRCCDGDPGVVVVETKKRKVDGVKKRGGGVKKMTQPICSEAVVSSSNSTKENIKPKRGQKVERKVTVKTKVLQEDGSKNSGSTKGSYC